MPALHHMTGTTSAAANGIAAAVRALSAGELVGLPTETVYGLAADATNDAAVAKIFAAKGRPSFNPLIIHVGAIEDARRIAEFDDVAERLAAAFWPGPLTLVLPRSGDDWSVVDLATAGLDTIAIRMPAHRITRAVIEAFGGPIAAPSANRSGRPSATTAQHVLEDLGDQVAVVLDDGPTELGLESTIVAVRNGSLTLLRPGAIGRDEIEAVAGRELGAAEPSEDATVNAPGMLASHYAPQSHVRLDASVVLPGEALLTFAGARPPGTEFAEAVRDLSRDGDLTEAAANLFAALRDLDGKADVIAVVPIPHEGLGVAINDRLARAAAPRLTETAARAGLPDRRTVGRAR